MDCLNEIIGLSQTVCECYEAAPIDAETSTSGLFIDELEGLHLDTINSIKDCASGGLFDILAKSRTAAIQNIVSDLMAQLALENTIMKNLSPVIGEHKVKGKLDNLDGEDRMRGVIVTLNPVKGAVIKINSIDIFIDNVGQPVINHDLTIRDVNGFDALAFEDSADIPFTNAVKGWITVPVAKTIEMTYDGSPKQIIITHNVTPTIKNEISCGCDGFKHTAEFTHRNDKYAWNNFLTLKSFDIAKAEAYDIETEMAAFIDNPAYVQYMAGIRLNITIECDAKDIICLNVINPDDVNARVIAKALQYSSGVETIGKILASGSINRFTMLDRERLMHEQTKYSSEYIDRLTWLSQNIDITGNDCITCKSTIGVSLT